MIKNEAPITKSSIIVTGSALLFFKWLGVVAGTLVVFNAGRKLFLPVFIFCFVFLCYAIFLAIGSYGLWAFYFMPFCVLAFSCYTKAYQKALLYITVCYVAFYVFAGFAKIFPFWNALDWMQGYTIENLLFSRQKESILYHVFGVDIFSLPRWVVKAGVLGSVVLELSVVLILFSHKTVKFIVPLVLLFHLVLFLTGTPGIVEYTFGALIFIPGKYIERIALLLTNIKTRMHVVIASMRPSS
ncbi:MAG TPA: hypothetical protein PKC39_01685 [Ferruginibacter sp.]|nr:hypothetical protein [Ferruginibacter sp.]